MDRKGKTVSWIGYENQVSGFNTLRDAPNPSAAEARANWKHLE